MSKINNNDVLFILDKTGLSINHLLSLIEEERDFNLVLCSIGSNLTTEDKEYFPLLSDALRSKLCIYYCSKDKNYDIEDKSYICNIVAQNYKYIYKSCYKLQDNQPDEVISFLSVINDKTINRNKISEIVNKFNDIGRHNIAYNIVDWINIIKSSKKMILLKSSI